MNRADMLLRFGDIPFDFELHCLLVPRSLLVQLDPCKLGTSAAFPATSWDSSGGKCDCIASSWGEHHHLRSPPYLPWTKHSAQATQVCKQTEPMVQRTQGEHTSSSYLHMIQTLSCSIASGVASGRFAVALLNLIKSCILILSVRNVQYKSLMRCSGIP